MYKKFSLLFVLPLTLGLFVASCGESAEPGKSTGAGNTQQAAAAPAKEVSIDADTRIVSLSGTITETLCELGLQDKIVGVDVTSTYPEAMRALPKVGHNRNLSPEAILAQNPTLVFGMKERLKPEMLQQLQAANAQVIGYEEPQNVEAAKALITNLAETLKMADKGAAINNQIDADLHTVVKPGKELSVLFIYARGSGMMMVAGDNTSVTNMITLAGAKNAVSGFEEYKPLTAEAVTAANPDVVLMFTDGLSGIGGMDGFLKIPGISTTKAGKNKAVIEMDGQFLTGFGPRTGKAVAELAVKLAAVK